MAEIKIKFPFGGLNKNQSFTDQMPDTSRDALNVRSLDPLTGRVRGAQRSGLQCMGVTSAEMCTNLIFNPETLDTTQTPGNDEWTNSGQLNDTAAVSPAQANPFGETAPKPAILLDCGASAGIAELKQSLTDSTFAAQQVLSLYVKRPTVTGSSQATEFELGLQTGGSLIYSSFDISAGGVVTLNTEDASPVVGYTVSNSAATSVGNGWYRAVMAVSTANTGSDRDVYIAFGRGKALAEDLWAWGAQLCEGLLTLPAYRSGAVGTAEKIQWIEPIVVDDRKITWAKNTPGTSVTTTKGRFGTAFTPTTSTFGSLTRYSATTGRLYVQTSKSQITIYDKSGNVLETVAVPTPIDTGGTITTQLTAFDIDLQDNLFVSVGLDPSGTMLANAPAVDASGNAISRTYRMQRDPVTGLWIIIWTFYHTSSWITCNRVRGGRLYMGRHRMEGFGVDDTGEAGLIVFDEIYTSNPALGQTLFVDVDLGNLVNVRWNGIDVDSTGRVLLTGMVPAQTSSHLYLVSSSDGTVLDSETNVSLAAELGLGCRFAFETDSSAYVAGVLSGGDSEVSRIAISTADAITLTWSQTTFTSSATLGGAYRAQIDVDKFDNVWVPLEPSGGSGTAFEGFESSAGASVASFTVADSSGVGAWSVAVESDIPNYRDTTTTWPEHVFVVSHIPYKVNLATPTLASGSPRTQTNVVVTGGVIKTFEVTDWTTSPPTLVVMTPNDSSSGAMQTLDFVQGTVLFNKVFFTDGDSYRVYDPKNISNSSDGEVTDYEALAGVIPPRCKLISAWNGRIVAARGDNEQEWFMSAQGAPFDYDFFPAVASATQAVQGSLARAGLVPDVTNGIIPYTDDLLIMGGDHSIWRFTGDPAAGGQIDLVSDITGMAFGKAWTKDPDGLIYFFGSRGGVYRMSPESLPQRISYGSIERDLQDLDLSANHVKLVWNYRDEGLHVFQMPYGAVTEQLDHWFWEQKTDSWWKDNFYNTSVLSLQPTAAAVVDGDDPDDRRLFIGGGGDASLSSGDGYLFAWDAGTHTDAGTAIYSKVLIGPFQSDDKEVRMISFTPVLASDQSGCDYRLYVTPNADTLSGSVHNGTLQAGRNPRQRLRGRGSHIFLEISDASINRWAFETATVEVYPAGRQRVRAT